MFINQKVFDPKLQSKAVYIHGHDVDGDKWDRVFLVNDTSGDKLHLINSNGDLITLHMENFDREDHLQLEVLERSSAIIQAQEQPAEIKRRYIEKRSKLDFTPQENASFIEMILQQKGEAMRPIDICKMVYRKFGYKWNKKSITGHINTAIKHNPNIIKVSNGLYSLKQFDQASLEI